MKLTDEQASVFMRMLVGALLALVVSPLQWWWLLFLPRLIRGLWTTAIAESNLNAGAVGDGGDSVGVLQFRSATWAGLGVGSLEDRTNPSVQGSAAVRYLRLAKAPWRLVAPGRAGLASWRALWTIGPEGQAGPPSGEWERRYLAPDSLTVRSWEAPPTVYYLAWIPTILLWQTPISLVLSVIGITSSPKRKR
jgi:hypothetical protein